MKNRTNATPPAGMPGTRACQRTGPVSSAPSGIDELTRAARTGVAAELGGLARGPQPGTAAIATAAVAITVASIRRDRDTGRACCGALDRALQKTCSGPSV